MDPRYNVDIQTHRNPSSRILAESEKAKITAIEAAICPLVKFVNAKRALESGISNRKKSRKSRAAGLVRGLRTVANCGVGNTSEI